jgi:integrase
LIEQKQEQETEQITYQTLASYRSIIRRHLRPKWGDFCLQDVRPSLVQDWLRNLVMSPKYKGHVRSLMYRLFDKAMIWELIDVERNPMELVKVRGISKRKQRPRHSPGERCLETARRISSALPDHGADCTVLRSADQRNPRVALDGLRFQAVGCLDPAISSRQATQQVEDRVLAGRSSARTGLHSRAEEMASACVETEGQWLFPSPVTGRPYHADSVRTDYLVPAGVELGLGRIGFHTFRHSYRTWLDETGAPVGMQQKLMRHAHISTTMDQYRNASMEAKRKASRPVVQRLLKRTANQRFAVQ